MKKFAKAGILVLAATAMVAAVGTLVEKDFSVSDPLTLRAEDFVPTGDIERGARWTLTPAADAGSNVYATMRVQLPAGKQDLSGKGVYVRVKNNTAIDTPFLFSMNGTNGHRVSASKNTANYTLFDANGANPTSRTSGRDWDSYIVLPANFDGFVYMEYGSELISDDTGKWPGNAGTEMTYNSVFALYFTATNYYEGFIDLSIGDVFSDEHAALDVSTLSDEAFGSIFVKDQNADKVNIARLEKTLTDFQPEGDLKGGADLSVTHTDDDLGAYFRFQLPATKQDITGGVYMRVKNNTGKITPVQFYVNCTNNHRLMLPTNADIYTLDANGENKTALKTREFGSYLMIPANFDGFLYIPNEVLVTDTSWAGSAGTSATLNSIFAFYFGISTKYDSYANFSIGDIMTPTTVLYDGSEVAADDFAANFPADYNGQYWTIKQHEGGFVPAAPEFDYGTVNFGDADVEGGGHLTFTRGEHDSDFAGMDIKLSSHDASRGDALAITLKNVSGDFPMLLTAVTTSGETVSLGGASAGKVKFVSNSGEVTNGIWGGNPVSIKTPTPFEGEMVIPYDTFVGDAGFSFEKLDHININIATFYDSGFNNIFGDVGYITHEDGSYHKLLDTSSLTEAAFKDAFKTTGVEGLAHLSRYRTPKASSWIGDVKIIDSLNYEDDEVLKQNVTYDIGDNACSYQKSGDGMKVHIGPYEPEGHVYGPYMCLGMFDKGATTDRKVAYREVEGEKEYARGITMYLKNLSRREIGINLQFDENGTTAKGTSSERWIVKSYPANYYAYDVVKDANYTLYAKSDQIQIPVGFEGYVRIPFESYSVPDWCHGDGFPGTDDELNLDKFTGNFFLTSDNTRYEDMEFFIKNVGLYFGKTSSGFLDDSHTIKANMGL